MEETELESLVRKAEALIQKDENWNFSSNGTNDYKGIAYSALSILRECAEKGKESPLLHPVYASYIRTKTTAIQGICSVVEEAEEEEE